MTRAHDRQKTLPQRSVVHVVRVAVCLSVAAGSYRAVCSLATPAPAARWCTVR